MLTVLSDLIKNLCLYFPLKKYKGAGAGPKILTFLNNGATLNNYDAKPSNFLSYLEDKIIAANLPKGGILAFFLDESSFFYKSSRLFLAISLIIGFSLS